MKPFYANLINALVLVAMGLWGYLASEVSSPNDLIPLAFGVIFAASSPLIRPTYRLVPFIITALTVLLLIALILSLVGTQPDPGTIWRGILMIVTCVFSATAFLLEFRRRRKAE